MIIRKLEPKERYRAGLVQAVAFEGNFDLQKEREAAQSAEEPEDGSVCWGALSEDEKEIYGCVGVSDYNVRFDGHVVKLGGVGGVSTLPAFRRGGTIRSCFQSALPEMKKTGQIFSFLYPFSTAYYHKFGYEIGPVWHLWTLPIRDLRMPDAGGRVEQLLPGDDLSPLLEIYTKFSDSYNLSAQREIYDKSLVKDNLLDQQRYIFVWQNEAGEPRAFLITHKDRSGGKPVLDCTNTFAMKNNFLFLDAQAFQGMLNFVQKAFASDYDSIRFTVPETLNLTSFLHEGNTAECKRLYNGMLRVTDVQAALSLCRCKGSGELRIAVEDSMIPENNAVWKLGFAPGAANRVEHTREAPDLSMPINEFSALICGTRDAGEIPWMPRVQLHHAAASVDSVFYRKKCIMQNLF